MYGGSDQSQLRTYVWCECCIILPSRNMTPGRTPAGIPAPGSQDTSSRQLSQDTSSRRCSQDTSSRQSSQDNSSRQSSQDNSSRQSSQDTSSRQLGYQLQAARIPAPGSQETSSRQLGYQLQSARIPAPGSQDTSSRQHHLIQRYAIKRMNTVVMLCIQLYNYYNDTHAVPNIGYTTIIKP